MSCPLHPFSSEDLRVAVSRVGASNWTRLRHQRLFVTGGTGFVGKWLLATLQEARRTFDLDCETVVLSRDPESFREHAPDLADGAGVQLLRGNVLDFDFPPGRFGVVLHAATDVVATGTPLQTFNICLEGTRRVLDFATRAQTTDFLLVSSGAVYGRQPSNLEALSEDYAGAPDTMAVSSAYGEGKRAAEWLTAATAAGCDMRAVTARLFAFIGPGLPLDSHFAIGNFLREALAQTPIVVHSDGTSLRSYLYAADMAGWLWKILFNGRSGQAYNVGGEEVVSIAELARRVTALLASPARIDILAKTTLSLAGNHYVPNVSKARHELRLDSSFSLDEGILRTAQWLRETVAQR